MSKEDHQRRQFDCCFLNEINHYLPQDLYGVGRQGADLFQLRSEILQDEQYDGLLFDGRDLSATINRLKINSSSSQTNN